MRDRCAAGKRCVGRRIVAERLRAAIRLTAIMSSALSFTILAAPASIVVPTDGSHPPSAGGMRVGGFAAPLDPLALLRLIEEQSRLATTAHVVRLDASGGEASLVADASWRITPERRERFVVPFVLEPGTGATETESRPADYVAVELPTIGGADALAFGINAQGTVVGTSSTADGHWHAFRLDLELMAAEDLGTLGGRFSVACAVNARGLAVGYATTRDGLTRAVLWQPGTREPRELPAPAGARSVARAVNDQGVIVGAIEVAPGRMVAAQWEAQSKTWTLLGGLGGSQSEAVGVNSAGLVVGWAETAGGSAHAFLFDPRSATMLDLTPGQDGSSMATSVSEEGFVVGYTQREDSVRRGWIWKGGEALRIEARGDASAYPMHALTDGGAVGYVGDADRHWAAIWSPARGLRWRSPSLGGSQSRAWAADSSGRIAGMAARANGAVRAVVWRRLSDYSHELEYAEASRFGFLRRWLRGSQRLCVPSCVSPCVGSEAPTLTRFSEVLPAAEGESADGDRGAVIPPAHPRTGSGGGGFGSFGGWGGGSGGIGGLLGGGVGGSGFPSGSGGGGGGGSSGGGPEGGGSGPPPQHAVPEPTACSIWLWCAFISAVVGLRRTRRNRSFQSKLA